MDMDEKVPPTGATMMIRPSSFSPEFQDSSNALNLSIPPQSQEIGGESFPQQRDTVISTGRRSITPKPTRMRLPLDPLTNQPISDPVIAPNGLTYSKQSLLVALAENDHRLAGCRAPVVSEELYVDRAMRTRIDLHEKGDDPLKCGDAFTCPITLDAYKDPVVASDGYTYDLNELRREFARSGISPMTRQPLQPYGYRNRALAQLIKEQSNMSQAPGAGLSTKVSLETPLTMKQAVQKARDTLEDMVRAEIEQSLIVRITAATGYCGGAATLGYLGAVYAGGPGGMILGSIIGAATGGGIALGAGVVLDRTYRACRSVLGGPWE